MASEEGIWIVSVLILFSFLSLTVNTQLAVVYALLSLAAYILGKELPLKLLTNTVKGNTAESVMWALAATVAFLMIGMALQPAFIKADQLASNVQGIAVKWAESFSSTFAAAENTPLLAGNPIVVLLVWGVLIPFVESSVLVRGYEWLTRILRTDSGNFGSMGTWVAVAISMLLFMYFHVVAKGITNNFALAMSFIFAGISVVMAGKLREAESPILFHIFVNLIAVVSAMGLLGMRV